MISYFPQDFGLGGGAGARVTLRSNVTRESHLVLAQNVTPLARSFYRVLSATEAEADNGYALASWISYRCNTVFCKVRGYGQANRNIIRTKSRH